MFEPTNGSRRIRRLFVPLLAATALLAAACSVSLGGSSGTGTGANASTLQQVSGGGRSSVVAAIADVQPAVVTVTSQEAPVQTPFGTSGGGQGIGTGFIVRSDGVIVTNEHVIENASQVTVTLPTSGDTLDATVVARDHAHDLAVLRVDASGLPTVQLGDSNDLQLGQQVVALGYALGLKGGPTVTSGIVSSLDRTIQVQDPNSPGGSRTYEDVLQTDAAINPGNSGGPLIDLSGHVVGIDSAGSSSAENIGFEIAIDAAKPLIDQALGTSG